ncbi:FAD synthase [Dissulfurispira thermophila]|uniref:FAD synthase n=2 Tax=root TaxID=1 RepID=A0A7G1GZ67_9BACT|nr:adenylyltransferase/cytidyltransferase family protein [Dissulfurispira thermophila]BCB95674.1 FAD synthase [Dissulfurispira thermophila]
MKKKVVCAGTFDHLHKGHIDFLKQAKSLGDELIVIVARDETVKRIKGFLPTHNERLRRNNVEDTGIPDMVVLGNLDTDLFQILEEIKPDVVALGYDQRVSEEEIIKRFPDCKVVRLSSFHPEKYKSSYFRNNH